MSSNVTRPKRTASAPRSADGAPPQRRLIGFRIVGHVEPTRRGVDDAVECDVLGDDQISHLWTSNLIHDEYGVSAIRYSHARSDARAWKVCRNRQAQQRLLGGDGLAGGARRWRRGSPHAALRAPAVHVRERLGGLTIFYSSVEDWPDTNFYETVEDSSSAAA
jgi:hypothetical protein